MSTRHAPASRNAAPIETARTLPGQKALNAIVRAALRAPVVSRLAGRRLLTLYVVGRRSGRRYAVPVAYTRHDGVLLVGSQFAWIRNLSSGEPVQVRLEGRRGWADVEVVTEEVAVMEHLAAMARDSHQFARFNSIGFDEDGEPRRLDLHRAWAVGTRLARLTPR